MPEIICFDSQILIWGIKKVAEPSQVEMIERAKHFIDNLDPKGVEVVIPMVVVTELLSREPFEKQIAFLHILQTSFRLKNFDAEVALECANLLRKNWEKIIEVRADTQVRKDKLKFDHIIIASAITAGASCIYSYDDDIKTFGNGVIEIREIPPLPTRFQETNLFTGIEE